MQDKKINNNLKFSSRGKVLLIFPAIVLLLGFLGSANAKDNANANTNSNANANANANVNSNTNNNNNSNDNGQNAVRYEDIDSTLQQKQQDLSEIESKIDAYNKMIEVKQSQQQTLNNQLGLIDNQIDQTKVQIQQAEKDIEVTDLQIQELDLKINDQNELLKRKQAALEVLINDLYRKDEKDIIEIILSYTGISSFVQEIAYTEQANERVLNKLEEINSIRKDMEAKQQEQKNKHDEILADIQKKNDKTYYLQGEQDSKEKLLTDTQGEEDRYQELLKRVEEEKQTLLGDIDELSSSKASELGIVQSNQPKPTSGLAGTDWYFAQRDPRWGKTTIGHSNTLMSKYGCAVTAVSMVLRYHGVDISPGIMAKQPIFSSDLIVWPDQWQNVSRVGGYSHGNINWDTIDNEIANHNPVIVFVRANGRGAGHYVVIHHKDNHGKYVVHDPYWGPNIFLDSTRQNIAVLYGSNTSVDQMIIYHNNKRGSNQLDSSSANNNKNDNSNSKDNTNKNSNKNGN